MKGLKFNLGLMLLLGLAFNVCAQTEMNTEAGKWNKLFGSKPNIIHILADDLGYDDITPYGAKGIKTPYIDHLSKQGVKFTDFYAPSSVCTPSRAAILTGKYSYKVKGCEFILFPHHDKGADPEKETLISKVLKKSGYSTALIGKWHMGSKEKYLPNNHGFDYFYGLPYCNDHGPERNALEKYGHAWPEIPLMENMDVIERPVDLFALPDNCTAKVLDFIEKNKDEPFFIHYANLETHTPWYIPERFQNKSEIGAYGDAVQTLDWSVGQILKKLEALNLLENTLIVFSSDNGPLYATTTEFIKCYGEFGRVNVTREHFLREGKGSAYFEGGDRVPAIFSWKGIIPKNTVTSEVAGGMDLFSTFAFLAGEDVSGLKEIDGKNILPLLTDPETAQSPHECFFSFMSDKMYALRKGDWKLSIDHLGYVRLFNLKKDPGEKNDLANINPDKMFELIRLAEDKSIEMGFKVANYR